MSSLLLLIAVAESNLFEDADDEFADDSSEDRPLFLGQRCLHSGGP